MKGKRRILRMLAVILILVAAMGFQPVRANAAAPKISKKKVTLYVEQTQKLTIKNTSKKVTWSTSKKSVATVSKKGIVTAKKAGTAKITGKIGTKKYVCTVTVKTPKLSATKATLYTGDKKTLKVIKTSKKITWTSSKKSVATVSSKGVVTAKGAGTATITAKFGKFKKTCKVTVKPAMTLDFLNDGYVMEMGPEGKMIKVFYTPESELTLSVKMTAEKNKIQTYTESCSNNWIKKPKNQGLYGTDISVSPDPTGSSYMRLYDQDKPVASIAEDFVVEIPKNYRVTFRVTVTDTKGNTLSETVQLQRAGIRLSENAKTPSWEEIDDFSEHVSEVKTIEHSESYGKSYTYKITVDRDAKIVKDLEDGTIVPGNTVMIPSCDRFPTGFYYTVTSYSVNDSNCVIEGRQPELEEIFAEEGTIEFNGGIDTEDPIAFIQTADGNLYSGNRLDQYMAGKPVDPIGGIEVNNASAGNNFKTKFLPEGIKLVPNVSNEKDGTMTIGINLDDLILYDGDKDGSTTSDQLILDGKLNYENIGVDGRVTFGTGTIGKFIPEQIAFGMDYDTNADLHLKTHMKFEMKDIVSAVKEAAFDEDFDNYMPGDDPGDLEVKMGGVSVDDKIFLGTVGLRLSAPYGIAHPGIKEVIEYDPVLFLSVYFCVEGSISCEASLGVQYQSHVERGFDIYNSKGQHVSHDHSFDKNTTLVGSIMKGTYDRETVSRTDHSDPQTKVDVTMKGQLNSTFGVGVMGGVGLLNIIPGDIYGELKNNLNGQIEASILGLTKETKLLDILDSEQKCLFENRAYIEGGYEFTYALQVATKHWNLVDLKLETSLTKERDLTQASYEYPGATLAGTIRDCETNGRIINDKWEIDEHEPVPWAEIRIYEKAQFNPSLTEEAKLDDITVDMLLAKEPDYEGVSDENGNYEIEHLLRKKYIVLVTKNGYHDYKKEIEILKDSDGYAKDQSLDPYVYKYNWLDECAPESYIENGTAKTYNGGDKDKYMVMSGIPYSTGFFLNNGNQGTGGTCDAIFNLDGKYSALEVRVGHLDDSDMLHGTLSIYLANSLDEVKASGMDYLFETYDLNSRDAGKRIRIALNGAKYARFSLKKTQWDNWMTSSFGFVEGVWIGSDGTQAGLINTTEFKDPYDGRNMDDTNFMNIVPIFKGYDCTVYSGNKTFDIRGCSESFDTGFVLSSHSVGYAPGNGKALFFPDGRYNTLSIDVGYVRYYGKNKVNVFLDGELEASQTYEIVDNELNHLSIPLYGARSVRIEIGNKNDNWSTDALGFVNGVWY